jgi:hypothetical protein
MTRLLSWLMAGAIAISMATPAMAKDRDHHTSREWREHHERESRKDNHRAYRHARWNNQDRDRHKGWDKGRKTGWHGNSMPPGQAKKHHDYDRDRWARDHRNHHHRTTYSRNRAPIVRPRTNHPYPATAYPTHQTQAGRGPIPVPNVGQRPTTTAQKPTGQGGPIPVPGR